MIINSCRLLCLILLSCQLQLITSESVSGDEIVSPIDEDHSTFHTNSGPVEGNVVTVLGHKVRVFYGIPYARPPVGELRFKPPQPVQPWTDVLKATKKTLPCYQKLDKAFAFKINKNMELFRRPWTEDCLTINIWLPVPKVINAPVLVVFHSGIFEFGSNNYPDGGILAAKASVIVMSVNYRLGPFGFLNLGTEDVSGNMGLLDQQLALKWIHGNAPHFNGLKEAIILVGASNAGGASVGYHLLSPGSAGYFTTVTSFSGSPTCPWAFQEREESIKNSKLLSGRLGCKGKSPQEDLDCLRNAHPEDIVDASVFYPDGFSLRILPTVDGTFITESPLEALISGRFKKTVIVSVTDYDEASIILKYLTDGLVPNPELGIGLDEFRKVLKKIAPNLGQAGVSAVEDLYVHKCDVVDRLKLRDAAINVYSDVLFHCCSDQFHELFVKNGGAVFLSVSSLSKVSASSSNYYWHGKGEEYGFGYLLLEEKYSPEEKYLANFMLKWIKERAQEKASQVARTHIPYDPENKTYTYWSLQGASFAAHWKEEECKLWNEIIPILSSSQKSCYDH